MTQIYRKTMIGLALIETLDEMIKEGLLTEELAGYALRRFDESVYRMFENPKLPMNYFKARRLANYRLCDDVWTLILDEPHFHDGKSTMRVDRVKIVAVKSDIGNMMRTLPAPSKSTKPTTDDDDDASEEN